MANALDSDDWLALRAEAARVARHAHAPYSKLHVGAAGLLDSGEIVTGCNIECASYGVTLCAECGVVSAAQVASGAGRLIAVVVTNESGRALPPCGRCRQLLYEFGGPHLLIDTAVGPQPMSEFLPHAFSAADLP